MKIKDQFKAARRVSVPLIGIETPDPAATIRSMMGEVNGAGKTTPVIRWDIVRGLCPLNDQGETVLDKLVPKEDRLARTTNPIEALAIAAEFPERTLLFVMNAHRFLDGEAFAQAVWNLRDLYKTNSRMLVLLAPLFKLPTELERDIIVLEETLPDDEALKGIVEGLYEDAGIEKPNGATMDKLVRGTRGLAAFPAEQAAAMSLTAKGIDQAELWERKRKMIEQTRGLSVVRGADAFGRIGGLENAKGFGSAIFKGAMPPSCVVFVDEIEKALGGASGPTGDSSGVSQDALGVLLRAMEDNNWTGQICVGPPGSGKSLYAKAVGTSHEVPTIAVDLGAAKGSLVGQSEQQIRQMVNVIQAVAGAGAYWIATCNRMEALPPELRRRFRYGIWYFDLPDKQELARIWELQLERYGMSVWLSPRKDSPQEFPEDEGWTGADVRNCVEIAWRLKCKLTEAARFITPVCKSDPESIEKLRRAAEGRFLSASYAGVYRKNAQNEPSGRRNLQV